MAGCEAWPVGRPAGRASRSGSGEEGPPAGRGRIPGTDMAVGDIALPFMTRSRLRGGRPYRPERPDFGAGTLAMPRPVEPVPQLTPRYGARYDDLCTSLESCAAGATKTVCSSPRCRAASRRAVTRRPRCGPRVWDARSAMKVKGAGVVAAAPPPNRRSPEYGDPQPEGSPSRIWGSVDGSRRPTGTVPGREVVPERVRLSALRAGIGVSAKTSIAGGQPRGCRGVGRRRGVPRQLPSERPSRTGGHVGSPESTEVMSRSTRARSRAPSGIRHGRRGRGARAGAGPSPPGMGIGRLSGARWSLLATGRSPALRSVRHGPRPSRPLCPTTVSAGSGRSGA